jgi:hypothetical protein
LSFLVAVPWAYIRPYAWLRAFLSSFIINILLLAGMIFFIRKSHVSAKALIDIRRGSTPKLAGSGGSSVRLNGPMSTARYAPTREGSSIQGNSAEETALLEDGVGKGEYNSVRTRAST